MIILQQNLKAINTTHMYDLLRSFFSPQIPSLVANELLFLLHIFSSLKAYKTDNEKLKVSKATQKFRVKMSKWTNQNMAKFPESLILNLLFTSLFINITVFQKIHHSIYHSMFSISIFVNIIMFLVAQICRFFAIKELYIIGTKTTKSKNWISLTCFCLIIVGPFLLWGLPQHSWTVSFITKDFNILQNGNALDGDERDILSKLLFANSN